LLHALQEEKTGVLVLEGPELLGDIEAALLHTDLPLLFLDGASESDAA